MQSKRWLLGSGGGGGGEAGDTSARVDEHRAEMEKSVPIWGRMVEQRTGFREGTPLTTGLSGDVLSPIRSGISECQMLFLPANGDSAASPRLYRF